MLQVQTKAPDFSAQDQYGIIHTLQQYQGQYVVLYFYPKDDTPGCIKEACELRDSYEMLNKKAVVLGVSADSVESHKKFAEKYFLPFMLLADTEKDIIKKYEAAVGIFIKRITYLINPEGIIVKVYSKVDPSTHAKEILKDLELLSQRG